VKFLFIFIQCVCNKSIVLLLYVQDRLGAVVEVGETLAVADYDSIRELVKDVDNGFLV
jgi:hypothetical protein